jgi:small subunit ribosomal protein S5
MSSLRPARALPICLLSPRAKPRAPAVASCRQVSSSTSRQAGQPDRRPRFSDKHLKASGLDKAENLEKFVKEHYPALRPEDYEGYTKAQIEAIRAGEAAIDPKDFLIQGRIRDDKGRIDTYVDDFATVFPKVDLKPEPAWTRNRNVKWETEEDIVSLLEKGGVQEVPFGTNALQTYRKATRSRDHYLQEVQEKEVDRIMQEEAAKLKGPEKERFLEVMEQVKTAKGNEIDLTAQDIDFMEKYPEIADKYIVRENEKKKFLKGLDGDAGAMFEREAMIAVLEEEANRLELLGNLDATQATLVKELRTVARAKRVENRHLDEVEDIIPDIKNLVLAPPLGKVPGVEGLYKLNTGDESGLQALQAKWRAVNLTTGMNMEDIRVTFLKCLVVRHVANQTRLGKIRSMSLLVVAGNGNGMLGLGMAKSSKDMQTANLAADMMAIRNMQPIRRYENRTIYGTVREKVSGTIVELRSRPPGKFLAPWPGMQQRTDILRVGFGLRVPYLVFEMCRAAGIHDISGCVPRARNPMNQVMATFKCLTNQPDPEEIAIGRGKKMVDVRKVYYGGAVY